MFKKRLKYIRKKRDLTQEQLAKKANIPTGTVSQFETDARKPSFDNLMKLAGALDVSVDYLMGRTDKYNERLTQETQIFFNYGNLTEDDRKLARDFMALLVKRN